MAGESAPNHDPSRPTPIFQWWPARVAQLSAMGLLELGGQVAGVYRRRLPSSHAPYLVRNAPITSDKPIVAFGDSLTEGYGVAPAQAWPSLLAARLGRPVINAGRTGYDSSDGLRRIHHDVLPLDPALVIIGFGGNDLMRRTARDQCFRNLRAMIDLAQNHGAATMLLGIRGAWIAGIDYHSPALSLAEATRSAFVPLILDDIWGRPWMMHDLAHPNARGHSALSRKIELAVIPLLGQGAAA